jgi:hypothetical protein
VAKFTKEYNMKLKDLIGEKMFSGIDFENSKIKTFEDCQCVNFVLDGKVYTAVEDPDDGYRSAMKEIKEGVTQVKNIFAPVKVLARMKTDDILELINMANGKTVFKVGTENYDNDYPCWRASFTPENLST